LTSSKKGTNSSGASAPASTMARFGAAAVNCKFRRILFVLATKSTNESGRTTSFLIRDAIILDRGDAFTPGQEEGDDGIRVLRYLRSFGSMPY